jgi:hypothetical protein
MRINGSGNIGIGTTNPTQKLEVNGNIKANGDIHANNICDASGVNCQNLSTGGGTPSGAVMAFDLVACPLGWSPMPTLYGRTIVGAGQGSGLTNRNRGDVFGVERHELSVPEMPSHTHGVANRRPTSNSGDGFDDASVDGAWGYKYTDSTGGDQAHENMQPSYALLYCKKD